MKQLIAVALLAAVALADRDYEAMFKAFKVTHAKFYASEAEEIKRFEAFTHNMKKAAEMQAANPLATFGATAHADRTAEELKRMRKLVSSRKSVAQRTIAVVSSEERAKARGTSIDWRKKGVVSPVLQQGDCGGDWAISAAGNIEGVWAVSGRPFVSASPQMLLSCDDNNGNGGCNGGGLPDLAFSWLLTNNHGSIITSASFPYSTSDSMPACPTTVLPVAANITGYVDITPTEDAMAAYTLANGPIAVVVDATSWEMYTGGIITNCVSQQVDMAALVVGYDDTNVPPYWILKNSWGTTWGEQGYIRVAKGSNQCLITSQPSSATVKAL